MWPGEGPLKFPLLDSLSVIMQPTKLAVLVFHRSGPDTLTGFCSAHTV